MRKRHGGHKKFHYKPRFGIVKMRARTLEDLDLYLVAD